MAETTHEANTNESPERFDPAAGDRSLMASEHLLRYHWAAQLASGKAVLDAGCGTGYGSVLLQRAGATSVTAIDLTAAAYEQALQESGGEVTFLEADIHELPFETGAFDLVVCFEVIEHVDRRDVVVAELKRVAGADGVLLISSPNRETYPPGNPHHVFEYLPEELRDEIGATFDNVRLYRQDALLASAVVAEGVDAGERLSAQLANRPAPGREAYAIAVASDGSLPALPDLALLGDPFEVRWWQEQQAAAALDAEQWAERERGRAELAVDRATQELARREAAAKSELAEAKRRAQEAGRALRDVESKRALELEELRKAQTAAADAERRHDEAQQVIQQIHRTRVWRIGACYWRIRDAIFRRGSG